jgi:hypothetical protein
LFTNFLFPTIGNYLWNWSEATLEYGLSPITAFKSTPISGNIHFDFSNENNEIETAENYNSANNLMFVNLNEEINLSLLFEKGDLGSENFKQEIARVISILQKGKDWGSYWDFSNIDNNFKKDPDYASLGYRWIYQDKNNVWIDIWQPQYDQSADYKQTTSQISLNKILPYDFKKEDFENQLPWMKNGGIVYKYVLSLKGVIKYNDLEQGIILMNIGVNNWNTYEYLINLYKNE